MQRLAFPTGACGAAASGLRGGPDSLWTTDHFRVRPDSEVERAAQIHLLRRKFDVDQCVRDHPFQISRMVDFIFRCPNTGLKVQHRWPDEEKPSTTSFMRALFA
jgi:hypothetical protein